MLHIGVLQFTIEVPYSESLKDKRRVVKSLKDRYRRSYNVSIAEFEDLDDRVLATLGLVIAASDIPHLNSSLDKIVNALEAERDAVLVDHQLEIISPR